MQQLLDVSLAFPTVILTILVGIALVYWLFVILGTLDIDIFGGDAAAGKGGIGLKGGGDFAVKVGGDIAIKAGGDIAVKAGGDAGIKAGDNHDGHGGHAGGIWAALGLGRVPLTISISLISFFAWIASIVLMLYLGDIGLPRWLIGTLVLAAALLLAIPPAAFIARPLGRVFAISEAKRRADYIGSVCTVTTGNVDATFGQARIEDGGDVHDIQVRCDKDKMFSRDDKALIIDFDDAREAYIIEPMDAVLDKKTS